MPMLIKVCGMKYPGNIRTIAALNPDYMGFMFYPNSPRFVKRLDAGVLDELPVSIKKVGVFVNENLENILTYIHQYKLDAVQLHGADNRDLCLQIKEEAKTTVIKAFAIMSRDNLKVTKTYEEAADIFLFDTKTDTYNNAGLKFDLNILHDYQGEIKFLLGGNISIDDVKAIRKLNHPKMLGVDLNSKFEVKPGLKNANLLEQFIEALNLPQTEIQDNEENL